MSKTGIIGRSMRDLMYSGLNHERMARNLMLNGERVNLSFIDKII